MKRYLVAAILVLAVNPCSAQKAGEWYKSNLENGCFGVELHKANELLKSKPVKSSPLVAVIGFGADIEHESLVNSIWKNSREILDGVDNDKNGFVDDIHGWNFLGSADGSMMDFMTYESDREWIRLKDKYADLIYDGKEYFKYNNGVREYLSTEFDKEEHKYFSSLNTRWDSNLGKKYNSYIAGLLTKEYVEKWDVELKKLFPGKTRSEIFLEDLNNTVFNRKSGDDDTLRKSAVFLASMYANFVSGTMKATSEKMTWEHVFDNFVNKYPDFTYNSYISELNGLKVDTRKLVVGDNYLDITDRKYGNNKLLTSNSLYGTMMSGIITSLAPDVKIMNLVVGINYGDPFLKDIALSIRYAVDNSADIIVLPQQQLLYPAGQKEWVSDALKYAHKKGVLVIIPAQVVSKKHIGSELFPNRFMPGKFKLDNLIIVANSNEKGIPANLQYNWDKVDILAPGENIFSTSPGDLYSTGSNPSYGAAVTAGVAALLKSYYPKLDGVKLRKLMLKNPTPSENIDLNIGILNAFKCLTGDAKN